MSQNKIVVDSIAYYEEKQDVLKAISYAERKGKIYLKQKKYRQYCQIALKKSALYLKLKEYDTSTKILFDTYKLIENKPLELQKAIVLEKIGINYFESLNINKSILYFKKASRIAKKIKNDTLQGGIETRILGSYNEVGNMDSCLYYAKNTLKIFKAKGTYYQKSTGYNNMFLYYVIKKQYELAKKSIDSSITYAKLSKNKRILNNCLGNLAYYYTVAEKNHSKAAEIYLEQLKNLKEDTLSLNATDNYLNLSYVYEELKEYKKANVYLNKVRINRVNIFNNDLSRQVNGVETRYKIQKAADEFKAKESLLKQTQKKRQLFFLIVIIFLVVAFIIVGVFYQNNKLKQKNKLTEIESNLKENLINATIDGQETERKNVATVLHDNVSALLSSAGLQLMAFSASQPNNIEEITKARAILKDAHDKVRDLSHRLVPSLLAKFGMIYALEDLCEKNSNSTITITFASTLNSRTRFQEDFEMKLYFIVSEMINNVLKHGNASQASVIITQENNNLHIIVDDEGEGFEIAKDKSNEGFGLTQIRARINNLNGTFSINSKKGKGTTVTIQVPIIEKPSTPIA